MSRILVKRLKSHLTYAELEHEKILFRSVKDRPTNVFFTIRMVKETLDPTLKVVGTENRISTESSEWDEKSLEKPNFVGMGYLVADPVTDGFKFPLAYSKGKAILIREMRDNHLLNALRWFKKSLKVKEHSVILDAVTRGRKQIPWMSINIRKTKTLIILLETEVSLRGLHAKSDYNVTKRDYLSMLKGHD